MQKTTAESPSRIIRVLRDNPTLLLLLTILYVCIAGGSLFIYKINRDSAEARARSERLSAEIMDLELSQRSLAYRSNIQATDIFKRLSFSEASSPADLDKMRAALSLNSLAKYALDNKDLTKASQTLDESLQTYPTLEADYYSGVVDYLQGKNDAALGFWRKIETSPDVPDDIYVYLALAEYRSGNTQAAKKYAELYSHHAPQR